SMYYDGILDEIRFSHVLRSDAWLKLCFENQKMDQSLVEGPVLAPEDYSNWSYSTDIILNTSATGANISGAVNNFPILLRLTTDNFSFGEAKSDGTDIRFSTSGGTHIPYGIAKWDDGGNLAQLWVKVPTINGNDNSQYITMYWGKADAGDSSNSEAVFDTAHNYLGAWHLEDDPTGGTAYDASANGYNGAVYGSMTTGDLVPGQIGRAYDFDGANDYVEFGDYT
ncbi:MAG: DUF2341 domain-containing protein, partial [Planctomycetes bacterium]|nr:DUF2341 domain-containing protein [Planctomycetota bacterium]